MTMMPTPTLSMVMKGGIAISNDDDADADRELGDDGGDHYPQCR